MWFTGVLRWCPESGPEAWHADVTPVVDRAIRNSIMGRTPVVSAGDCRRCKRRGAPAIARPVGEVAREPVAMLSWSRCDAGGLDARCRTQLAYRDQPEGSAPLLRADPASVLVLRPRVTMLWLLGGTLAIAVVFEILRQKTHGVSSCISTLGGVHGFATRSGSVFSGSTYVSGGSDPECGYLLAPNRRFPAC